MVAPCIQHTQIHRTGEYVKHTQEHKPTKHNPTSKSEGQKEEKNMKITVQRGKKRVNQIDPWIIIRREIEKTLFSSCPKGMQRGGKCAKQFLVHFSPDHEKLLENPPSPKVHSYEGRGGLRFFNQDNAEILVIHGYCSGKTWVNYGQDTGEIYLHVP